MAVIDYEKLSQLRNIRNSSEIEERSSLGTSLRGGSLHVDDFNKTYIDQVNEATKKYKAITALNGGIDSNGNQMNLTNYLCQNNLMTNIQINPNLNDKKDSNISQTSFQFNDSYNPND